jgi:hypothetical protein
VVVARVSEQDGIALCTAESHQDCIWKLSLDPRVGVSQTSVAIAISLRLALASARSRNGLAASGFLV